MDTESRGAATTWFNSHLHFFWERGWCCHEEKTGTMKNNLMPDAKIQITKDGPYLVSGGLPLSEQRIVTNAEGESLDYREGRQYPAPPQYALCRCGQSTDKPFCDGSHKKVRFDGTETASRERYLKQAETIAGPTVSLTDAESLCAFARFCDPKGRIWNLVAQTDNPETRKIVEFEAAHCPAGRLVVWDKKTGQAMEPEFQPSIGLIEDTDKQVSGPVWVRGGIPVISANGKPYEVRNRVTLCRCGRSSNKPFCDGSHAA
jgi:CDGSH-type Zn-finger protein